MTAGLTASDRARHGETAEPGNQHQMTGPRGPVRVHRPERSWPHPPAARVIELMTPPPGPDDAASRWASARAVLGDRGARAQRWARVKARYQAHLEGVRAEAAAAAAAQRTAGETCFPEPDTLPDVAVRDGRVWERRPGHPDFAAVRLGRGPVPALCPVQMARDEGPFGRSDPDLADAADRLVRESAVLPAAPVVIRLGQVGSVAVVGEAGPSRALVASWLAGLAAFHAPNELRIMGLVPPESVRAWDWLKWLPHTRNPEAGEGFGRLSRAVTTDPAVFAAQAEALARRHHEHVVVVVDGYRPEQGLRALDVLLPADASEGVTVILLVRGETDVPATCGAKIHWEETGTVRYTESGPDGLVLTRVQPDRISPEPAARLARVLAPLAPRTAEPGADFADPVRLVELLGADDAGDLDVAAVMLTLGSLAAGVPPELLCVPVGRAADGEPLSIDLKAAGPHGIVVGATGSGKSELLRSFATALAVRHDPALVNLLLVDTCGAGTFADLAEFPHVAGLVTNLAGDPCLSGRLRLALAGELTRRQQAIQDAGCGSIAEYHQALAQGTGLAPLPYLVIAVDACDDLLAASPDLLETFGAIGGLGRSLGVHLLLAAGRLGEGRIRELEPCLHYRICLRTASAGESRAVLGTDGAFELPSLPGLGYLSVGGALARFRAATCGTVSPQAPDTQSVVRVLAIGSPGAAPAEPAGRVPDTRVLARAAWRAAPQSRARAIWTAPLPRALTLGALRETLGGALEHQDLHQRTWVAAGLADRPEQQIQEALWYSPHGPGANLGLAGAPGTGKSSFLSSLLLALCSSADASQRQFYCLDLGGGVLSGLASLPHVGAVARRGEAGTAARIFRELRALLDERAGRGQSPRHASRPDVYLVIDDAGQLQTSPELERVLIELATVGVPHGLHVILTVNRWTDIRPRLLDALGTRWELRLAEPGESLAGRQAAERVPSGIPGRGLTSDGHLLQIALPSLRRVRGPGDLAAALTELAAAADGTRAPEIVPLPLRVTSADAGREGEAPGEDASFLLGVGEFRSQPVQLDVAAPGTRLLVDGEPGSGRTTLLRRIAGHLLRASAAGGDGFVLHIVDPRRGLLDIADHPGVGRYASGEAAVQSLVMNLIGELHSRAVPEDAGPDELRTARSWTGPCHVLLVDDYDLLISPAAGLIDLLADFLAQGPDIGLSVILARREPGTNPSEAEPFARRLREVADHLLVLAGPPGRATLTSGHSSPRLIQCVLDQD